MIGAMGLKNWAHNRRMTDPVDGTYRVTSCSRQSGNADYENCRMHGVVVAPGVEATATEHRCMAPQQRLAAAGPDHPGHRRSRRSDPDAHRVVLVAFRT